VAVGAGAVWVAAEDSNQLIRIDPESGIVTAALGVGHGPDAVAAGGDAVWVANGSDGTVSRVDPATNAVAGTERVGAQVTALAAGAAGAVAADDRGVVARIGGDLRIASHLRTGVDVRAILAGPQEVWIAAAAAPARHRGGTLTAYAGGCGQPCPVDPAFALRSPTTRSG
jgi:DNA-binding beta-propeller fold protein YncE